MLVWNAPAVIAQEVIGYTMVYTGSQENEEPHDSELPVALNRDTARYRVEGLRPGYMYHYPHLNCSFAEQTSMA